MTTATATLTAPEIKAIARIARHGAHGVSHKGTRSRTAMVRSILATYREATPAQIADGRNWYPTVRALLARLADHYGVDLATAAGVFAETSPRCSVSDNLRITAAILAGDDPAEIGGLDDRIAAGARVFGGDFSNLALDEDGTLSTSRKVRSFFANLLGDRAIAVTVDVWAMRVAGLDPRDFGGRKREAAQCEGGAYVAVAEAYRRAADILGIPVRDLQAITWTVARGSAGLVELETMVDDLLTTA